MKRILKGDYPAAPRLIRFARGEVRATNVRLHRQRVFRAGGGVPAGNELDSLA